MKRIITAITILALWAPVVRAQHTIEDIRKDYANVKEYIGMMSEDFPSGGIPAQFYHLHVAQNLPATGPHFEDVRMYYGEEEGGELIYEKHYLWFLTTKYNFAAREYYEEYLYDKNGKLTFAYGIEPDLDTGEFVEYRLYYDGKRLLKCIVKKRKMDGETEFREVYNGTKIPEEYTRTIGWYEAKAKQFIQLFKDIESVAYPYNE